MFCFDFCVILNLTNNLGGYSFGETADGRPGFRKPGADSVTPFCDPTPVTLSQNYHVASNGQTAITINFSGYFKQIVGLVSATQNSGGAVLGSRYDNVNMFKIEGAKVIIYAYGSYGTGSANDFDGTVTVSAIGF